MKLRPIGRKEDYYPTKDNWKVLLRRFLIAFVIVMIIGVIIWMKIKN